jgi:secondary thiamine-phosphate synthase enzyme
MQLESGIRPGENSMGEGMRYTVHCESVQAELGTGPDVADLTPAFERVVREAGVVQGVLMAQIKGSTGSITAIEFEPGVVEDLKQAVTRLAPPDMEYAHEQAWHDGNGHSHVQAALMGPSVNVAVRDGRLALGTWQQIVAVNHDNKPRRRIVEVTVMGEKA